MSAISLVMSSGSSSVLRSGVEGLLPQRQDNKEKGYRKNKISHYFGGTVCKIKPVHCRIQDISFFQLSESTMGLRELWGWNRPDAGL